MNVSEEEEGLNKRIINSFFKFMLVFRTVEGQLFKICSKIVFFVLCDNRTTLILILG